MSTPDKGLDAYVYSNNRKNDNLHGLVYFVLGYKNHSLAEQHHLSHSSGNNSKLLIFYNRHIEWFELEGTLKIDLFQPPCHGQA